MVAALGHGLLGTNRLCPNQVPTSQRLLDYLYGINRTSGMGKIGRPATGHQPVLSVRMAPEALQAAKAPAKAYGTTLGRWLEAAIKEKQQRDRRRVAP